MSCLTPKTGSTLLNSYKFQLVVYENKELDHRMTIDQIRQDVDNLKEFGLRKGHSINKKLNIRAVLAHS